eukprot:TRINITY_DN68715_c0_g1_i1.p1 TRINITY_DN68715_c0_g1~~TRINITY_DN68715_c0_g1_i1.p1  ORF type:complete len:363 (+),score=66.95 TRINITY_DN68715_c0_g1_i1:30-1091(+)
MGSSSRPPSAPRGPGKRVPAPSRARQQSSSPSRLRLSARPRQLEQEAWSTSRHLEEALKAAEPTCFLAISDVKEVPPSPITAAVAKQQAEQSVAIVRRVSLSRPPSASLERLPTTFGPGVAVSSSCSSRSATPRSAPLSARPGLPPQPPTSEASLRLLSQEELETKTADALNWFHGARAINQRSRSVDAVEAALATVRRRRTERSASAERRRKDLERAAAARSTETCAAEPSPAEETPAAKHKDLHPDQDTPAAKPTELHPDVPAEEQQPKPHGNLIFKATATAVTTTVRRKSLAEQFGYGVAPKQQEEKPAEQPPEDKPKKILGSGFIGVQAGDTDLLQRLAARRRTADAGA